MVKPERGLGALIAGAVLLCLVALPVQAFEPNLAPLLASDTSEEGRRLDALGPILSFSPAEFAIRPLFYRDAIDTYVLYPLGHFTEERSYFFPLYARTCTRSGEHTTLFPFFRGRDEGQTYAGLFPVAGRVYHRFGWDEASFLLWPLYSRTERDSVSRYRLLWPIIAYSPQREIQVFPLYGYRQTATDTHQYALWPLIHHRRGVKNMDALLPLFLRSSSPAGTSTSVLWPFCTYASSASTGQKSLDLLWPFIRFAWGETKETRIFPLYQKKTVGDRRTSTTVLWPLYRSSRTLPGPSGAWSRSTSILILSSQTQRLSASGEQQAALTIWPLVSCSSRDEETSWVFPALIPLKAKGFLKTWAPILTLAHGEKTSSYRRTDILWHTLTCRREGGQTRISLSCLASFEQGPDYRQAGFLFDLISLRWSATPKTP